MMEWALAYWPHVLGAVILAAASAIICGLRAELKRERARAEEERKVLISLSKAIDRNTAHHAIIESRIAATDTHGRALQELAVRIESLRIDLQRHVEALMELVTKRWPVRLCLHSQHCRELRWPLGSWRPRRRRCHEPPVKGRTMSIDSATQILEGRWWKTVALALAAASVGVLGFIGNNVAGEFSRLGMSVDDLSRTVAIHTEAVTRTASDIAAVAQNQREEEKRTAEDLARLVAVEVKLNGISQEVDLVRGYRSQRPQDP